MKKFRVYGRNEDGIQHRMKLAFGDSMEFTSTYNGIHYEFLNHDKTGTLIYTEVHIEVPDGCEREEWEALEGQISDGMFENMRTGKVLMFDEGRNEWREIRTEYSFFIDHETEKWVPVCVFADTFEEYWEIYKNDVATMTNLENWKKFSAEHK